MTSKFLDYKGENIKIAIVDSGLSNHKNINLQSIVYKKSLAYKDGDFIINNKIYDEHGHGTAVTSIINKYIPKAKLYIFKILDNNNRCSGKVLVKILENILNMDIDIINLSLGTEDFRYINELIFSRI
ncbi:S8 family serine peptidase [Clostridium tetani]|uniref:S8 family serine peptidase n=1 Tax=Clostridium tetani TaxID=1513 RepID=UPI002955B534|nr:S8 family serine peptidase [Clostridium tetani]BDR65727.1 hypothetical protein K134307016_p10380 [Clostridium tetani]